MFSEKIYHIFQRAHNELCYSEIEAGRFLQMAVIYQPIYQLQTPIFQLLACNYQQIYSAHIVTAMGDSCYRGAKLLLQHWGNGVFSLR